MRELPCGGLRELQLQHLEVQLEQADGYAGLLRKCTGLTALDLQECWVQAAPAAFAAIAALSELQRLRLLFVIDHQERSLFGQLQYPLQLTYLALCFDTESHDAYSAQHLSQLSALVNLEHLGLNALSWGLPGGVPSELVKLTCLGLSWETAVDLSEQLQHRSSFKALQRLSIQCEALNLATDLPGIKHLSQLSSLHLTCPDLEFSTNSTRGLASLTALQELDLRHCKVQPAAVAALTQLQGLRLDILVALGDATYEELLAAVAALPLLTDLQVLELGGGGNPVMDPPPAAAFTALTASTNLCSLQHSLISRTGLTDCIIFRPGLVYPHLCTIDLTNRSYRSGLCISEQQLQQLCTCCFAVESLAIKVCPSSSRTALLPLRQLSALTNLRLYAVGGTAAAAAVDVMAQLTGLKHLAVDVLQSRGDLDQTVLLQLTALTGLRRFVLSLAAKETYLHISSQARWCNPPDVWIQLLRELLRDAACRQALLRRSSGAAAAPSELMLAQLAATLAEELAAG